MIRVNFKCSAKYIFLFSGSEKKCFIKLAFSNCIYKKKRFLEFQESFILTNFLQSLKKTVAIHCPKKKNFFSVTILWPNFFVMNWTWISYFIKATRAPVIQMEYTLTHQMTGLSQTLSKGDWQGVPNKHFLKTNGPQW